MVDMNAIEWGSCLLEPLRDPEQERFLRRSLRAVPPAARYLMDVPWLLHTIVALDSLQAPRRQPDLGALIALVVSQDNSCRYCYAATRSILKIIGFPEWRIRQLQEDMHSADLSREERLAIEFARRVSRGSPLATRLDAAPLLEAGYSEKSVRELAVVSVTNVFYNRVATLPALPPEEVAGLPDRWFVRLLRPLVARFFRRRFEQRGERDTLTAAERQGPFSAIVVALDGLPAAVKLRQILDEAWASPLLGRRAKALVFAVVARGLGCPLSEREATRLLLAEGMTEEQVEHALANLASPVLDPVESAVVPFARETIWYRPAQIQRRARAVRQQLSRAQFVELVGLAALANSLCRLSVVLDLARTRAET